MDMDTLEGSGMLAICWLLCIADPQIGRPIMQRAGLPEEAMTALTEFMACYASDFAIDFVDAAEVRAGLESYDRTRHSHG